MSRTATITVLFSDIVGSTELLARLGEREWDEVRRQHFSVLREALADHEGTEVKNTGDGLMAVFASAIDAVDCALTMHQQALQVVVGGTPVGLRIGISSGEATQDQSDWFGTPVVEAARLCALARRNESWATGLVRALAELGTDARFVAIGPQSLKGFDQPVEAFAIEAAQPYRASRFAQVDRHDQHTEQLVGFLDYWESLPSLQRMQSGIFTELAPLPGDVICDVGCGTGTELLRIARVVGPQGHAIGVDPSPTLLEVARDRARSAGIAVELLARDGRETGLPTDHCDAVRMERVVQHVGDVAGLLGEATRITRPGGRIVVADTDWGSLMIHPGDRDLIRRFKTALETGPMAEPWAGRTLHDAMLDAGLVDVTSRTYTVTAGPNEAGRPPLRWMFEEMAAARLATRSEIDDLDASLTTAFTRGGAVVAFTMFVATGRAT